MDIKVQNLTKKFNNYLAVNNISFTLERGKTLGLLGPNGCGKTTSIGMMLGLITPTSGEVLINNKNVNSANRNDLLSRMNFASPYIELPKKLTVKQNLEVYGRLYGIEDRKNRINEKKYLQAQISFLTPIFLRFSRESDSSKTGRNNTFQGRSCK